MIPLEVKNESMHVAGPQHVGLNECGSLSLFGFWTTTPEPMQWARAQANSLGPSLLKNKWLGHGCPSL